MVGPTTPPSVMVLRDSCHEKRRRRRRRRRHRAPARVHDLPLTIGDRKWLEGVTLSV